MPAESLVISYFPLTLKISVFHCWLLPVLKFSNVSEKVALEKILFEKGVGFCDINFLSMDSTVDVFRSC